tara:strand:+ start:1414 stop:1575 length:162 start_codon:yes stop_codon:yes gene_type:complete
MTRCTLLDKWFDDQSTRLDIVEKETGIEFITGEKLSAKHIAWRKVMSALSFFK